MTIAKTLRKEDNVFATLVAKGKTLKTIVGNNFSNLSELIRLGCKSCGDYRGLAQLNVRNQSQGWSMNMLLMIDSKVAGSCNRADAEPPLDGLQYCFPW